MDLVVVGQDGYPDCYTYQLPEEFGIKEGYSKLRISPKTPKIDLKVRFRRLFSKLFQYLVVVGTRWVH